MTSERNPRSWHDRYGNDHEELLAQAPADAPSVPRVPGSLELAWNEESPERERLLREALFAVNPTVSPGSDEAAGRLYTWVVSEPFATSVLLLANGVFDPADVEQSQFARLDGTGTWTLTLQMPSDWRASYRIAVWEGDAQPPWKSAGKDEVASAALAAALPDPRCEEIMTVPAGRFSVVSGPDAPEQLWGSGEARGHAAGSGAGDGAGASVPAADAPLDAEAIAAFAPTATVDVLEFPQDEGPAQKVWVYRPPQESSAGGSSGSSASGSAGNQRTPLLVLFDGQVWNGPVGLPELLEAAISAGTIPPVHVAMVDAGGEDDRLERLGVPGGQVDFVLDQLLERLRSEYPVDPSGDATIVAGQGQGALSALWALALGKDTIGHAIAQSPSLWRFDVTQALVDNHGWKSATIQTGRYEGRALELSEALAEAVSSSQEIGNRTISVEAVSGGHDWAWWRAGLFQALAARLK